MKAPRANPPDNAAPRSQAAPAPEPNQEGQSSDPPGIDPRDPPGTAPIEAGRACPDLAHSHTCPDSAHSHARPGSEATSLQELYRQYWPELCGYLKKMLGMGPPEPEDIAQAAFVKYAGVKHSEAIENPRAFLYATARNLVTDHHRRAQRHLSYTQSLPFQDEEENLDEISPERVLMGEERAKILEQALRRLPAKQRRIVLLHRLHGLTYTKIAEQTQSTESTVRRHVAEAVATLQKALQNASGELTKRSRQ